MEFFDCDITDCDCTLSTANDSNKKSKDSDINITKNNLDLGACEMKR
ncbi:hypothetical protein M917_0617 [Psychrobacter aquaticus CMS 56]|uniref:Uncharacterized protein n=1 Tax=Psychrobacter aquaticus CMS 56 TaxID=1354303 RepID=U4T911_9GAMM|nr:hypothetical protein M917_0617 [Psychrobacter aquaticus CMS 56]